MMACARRAAIAILLLVIGCDAEQVETTDPGSADTAASDGRRELSDAELDAMRALEPERAARALAEVEARFAQRDPHLEFRIERSTTTRLGDAHVLVQQVYRGIPVEQRDLLVIVGTDDKIRVLGEPDHFDGVSVPAPSALDPAHAWAFQHGATLSGARERRLQPVFERRLRPGASGGNAADWENVVVGFESGTRVEVRGGDDYDGARALFVRDRDGAVVERDVPTHAFVPTDLRGYFAHTTEYPLTYKDDTWDLYRLQDGFGNTVQSNAAVYFSVDNIWGDGQLYYGQGGTTVNGETAGADAMISVWAASKMYQMVYRQVVKPTTVLVHASIKGAENYVGDGAADPDHRFIRCGYVDLTSDVLTPMTDIEVIGHEYGHLALRDKTGIEWSGAGLGELDGIGEASADIFGLNAHFYMQDALHPFCARRAGGLGPLICTWPRTLSITDNWVFGDISNQPAAVRSFIDPKIKEWTADIATTPGHEAGGPLRRMYYFLSVGVQQGGLCLNCYYGDGNNVPQRTSFYLPQGLAGLGVDVANKIWWHTIDGLYIKQATDYASYREAMLQATTDLYGKYSTEYRAVEDAWAAVNVGKPADRTPPELELMTGLTLKSGDYMEARATDENGVASVEFYLSAPGYGDLKPIGVATTAPYRIVVDSLPTYTYTLTIEAWDTRGNRATRTYYPVTFDDAVPTIALADVTPCAPATSEWCGDYRTQRIYRVTASALSQIQSVSLMRDGMPVGTYAGSSHDFIVSYTVGGEHLLRGSTLNQVGTANYTAWQTYNIDLTPPEVTRDVVIAQSINAWTQEYVDKLVEMDYCAKDPSGMALRSGKQRIDFFMDGTPYTAEERDGHPAGCPSYYIRNVPAGQHSFLVRIYDKWGNYAEAASTVNVVAVKPFVHLYPVYVDPAVLGKIDVNGWYNSTGDNIASIAYYVCRQGSTCTLEKSDSIPPGPAPVGSIEFHYETLSLWPGETYKVQITVTGTNGTSTTVESTWFTIPTTVTTPPPPPTEHVYNEVEPNDGYFWSDTLYGNYNVPPSDTTIIRGSAGQSSTDMFLLTAPAGESVCIAGARYNDSYGTVAAWVFWYRTDGTLIYNAPDVANSPEEITEGDFRCYGPGALSDPAFDGKYYLYVQGPFSTPDDYEFQIKYISDTNFAPPAPSL